MDLYIYEGPVEDGFGKNIESRWKGETVAVSEKKARSNLTYQYKKETGRLPNTKIRLTGRIIKIGG